MLLLILDCYDGKGCEKPKEHQGSIMQNFVLSGKAKTVFRIIELKAKQEAMTRRAKEQGKRK